VFVVSLFVFGVGWWVGGGGGCGKVNTIHILNLAVGLIALSAAYSDRLYSWYTGDREGGSTTASLEAR
jgi:hypothetical protein